MTAKDGQVSQLSQLKDFISSLSSVKGDLSSVTAPPFVLAPKSAVEIPTAWASKHELFLQPSYEPDAATRALLVAKNFVCSLKTIAGEGTEEQAKKPLNPFLGELFVGTFEQSQTSTTFISEQVSHHPPVTACAMHNRDYGISSTGFVAQETTFSVTSGVRVCQRGYAMVRDEKHDEAHLFTLPTLLVKGVLTGSPYVELEGPCYVSSSSGYVMTIKLGGSSMIGLSKRFRVEAELVEVSKPADILYRIRGNWNEELQISDADGNELDTFHVDDIPSAPLSVQSTEAQSHWESRRAWQAVFEGIQEGSMEKVSSNKVALEERQRKRREQERKTGKPWSSLFFRHAEGDQLANKLLSQIPGPDGVPTNFSKTAGAWHFIGSSQTSTGIQSRREMSPP